MDTPEELARRISVCTPRNLHIFGYANGFTMWHYLCSESAEFADATYYNTFFAPSKDMLRVGDIIFIMGPGQAALRFVRSIHEYGIELAPLQ